MRIESSQFGLPLDGNHGMLGYIDLFLGDELILSRESIEIGSIVDAFILLQEKPEYQQRYWEEFDRKRRIGDQIVQEAMQSEQLVRDLRNIPESLIDFYRPNANIEVLLSYPSFFLDLRDQIMLKKEYTSRKKKFDFIKPATAENTFLVVSLNELPDPKSCFFVLNREDTNTSFYEDPLRHAARFAVSMETRLTSKFMQDKGYEYERAKDFIHQFLSVYMERTGIKNTKPMRLLMDYYMIEQALLRFHDGRLHDNSEDDLNEYSHLNLQIASDYFVDAFETSINASFPIEKTKPPISEGEALDVYFNLWRKSTIARPSKEVFENFLGRRVTNIIPIHYRATETGYVREIFLEKRAENKAYGGHMGFLGGHVKAGETMEGAAKRELKEESDVTKPITYWKTIRFIDKQGAGIVVDVWYLYYRGKMTLKEDEIAIHGSGYYTLDELQQMIHDGVPFTGVAKEVLTECFDLKFPEE